MFIQEKKYSREEIFKSYFPSEEFPKWGQWRTGYIEIKESNELVVFINIGVPSNTSGEEWDFNNSYDEETGTITWYGKPDRKSGSKQSQKILSGGLVLRFFARWDNKEKFSYLGIGNVVDYKKEVETKKGDGTPAISWEATVLLEKPDNKWTDKELEAAVEAYRRMQWLVTAHIPLNKSRIFNLYNEETLSKRSRSSFERRMMNISHVIESSKSKRDKPSLVEHGYKPLSNVGTNVEKTLQVLLNESSTKEYAALQICKRLGIDASLVTSMEQVGSTINKDFYDAICSFLNIGSAETKQESVRSILENRGIPFDPEECFSKGSTITAHAIRLINAGLDKKYLTDKDYEMNEENSTYEITDSKADPGESIEFAALKVAINDKTLYIGSLAAKELFRFSDVPSFDREVSHIDIARNVQQKPIKDWQRPVDIKKVNEIAFHFDKKEETMPNPVLVAARNEECLTITQKVINNSATGVLTIKLSVDSEGKMPLWILDGQHRVSGLNKATNTRENHIPLVMLAIGEGGFTQPEFAKIFAEVSTQATPLNALHREWMEWAFDLGPYAIDKPDSQKHRQAMQTVVDLCSKAQLGGKANPFTDKIAFNPHNPPKSPTGHNHGFQYVANELKKIIVDNYYKAPGENSVAELDPEDLATEIAKAMTALKECLIEKNNGDKNVFQASINSGGSKHVQDGFLIGVLRRLRNSDETQWNDYLKAHKIHEANWDFSSWIGPRSGNVGNVGRDVSKKIFIYTIGNNNLLKANASFEEFFEGDPAVAILEAYPSDNDGNRIPGATAVIKKINLTKKSQLIELEEHLKHIKIYVPDESPNVGVFAIKNREQGTNKNHQKNSFHKGTYVNFEDSQEQIFDIETQYFGAVEQSTKLTLQKLG